MIITGYGISNYGVQNLQVLNNYIYGNQAIVGMEIGSYNRVKNNVVANTERGIEAAGTQNLIVKYNNLWNNDINYTGFTPDTTNLSVDPMIVNDDTTQGELGFSSSDVFTIN